jgi:hypothetical protein
VDRGVRLSLGGTIYDPTDPLGKMFFNILATFAEFEVDLLRLRTREGMPSPARRASRAASSRSTPPGSNASWYGCTTPASTPRPTSRAVHRLPSHRVPGPRTPPRHRSLNRRGTPIVVFAMEATATPLLSHATARPRHAGTSFESQGPARGPAADMRARPAGTSQRYEPGSLPSRPGPATPANN